MYILIPPRFILKFPLATKLKNGLGWSQLEISQLLSRTKDIKLEKITKNPLKLRQHRLSVGKNVSVHTIFTILSHSLESITRGWQCISDGVRIGLMPPPLPSPELQPPPAGWAAAVPQLRKMTKLKLIQSLTSFSFCCYRAKRGRVRRPELNLEIGQYQKQHPGLDRQGKRTMLWPCHFVISPDYFSLHGFNFEF